MTRRRWAKRRPRGVGRSPRRREADAGRRPGGRTGPGGEGARRGAGRTGAKKVNHACSGCTKMAWKRPRAFDPSGHGWAPTVCVRQARAQPRFFAASCGRSCVGERCVAGCRGGGGGGGRWTAGALWAGALWAGALRGLAGLGAVLSQQAKPAPPGGARRRTPGGVRRPRKPQRRRNPCRCCRSKTWAATWTTGVFQTAPAARCSMSSARCPGCV